MSAGFKPGERRSAVAAEELTRAYHAVFGNGSNDAEIVLADLANYCGFYQVPPPDASAEQLRYEQGLRTAYARIHHFLSLTREQHQALETAARAESLADNEEGLI